MVFFSLVIKKIISKLPSVLAIIVVFAPIVSSAQDLDFDNKLTLFRPFDNYATPFQKIILLEMDEALRSANFGGSGSLEFDIGPTGGAILDSAKKSWFLIKELPIGEKLFEIQTAGGKKLYCNTQTHMDLRYCLMDIEDDGFFDFQCNSLTEVRAAQASFFPDQLKYAIMRITTPCFVFGENDKPKYTKISAESFPRVRVRIIAEKLPFNQIRVSWGVPYSRNNFQWGGMIQEVIPTGKPEYLLTIGGVGAKIDLTKLVGNGRRYEIKMTNYDTSVPFINIDRRMVYSPFMNGTALQ